MYYWIYKELAIGDKIRDFPIYFRSKMVIFSIKHIGKLKTVFNIIPFGVRIYHFAGKCVIILT